MALDAVFAFLGIMKMSIFRHVVIISGQELVRFLSTPMLPIPKTNFINQEAGVNSRIGKWNSNLSINKRLKCWALLKIQNCLMVILLLKELQKSWDANQFEHPDSAVFGKEGQKSKKIRILISKG
jgi:cholesterol oxidase